MITVVLTTCKREPKIVARAIQSVIAQTYSDWELFVIDDSPSEYMLREEVKDMVLSFSNQHNISYYANVMNSGVSYSRNIGIEKASGSYMAFLDDDDEWLPEKLDKQIEALEKTDINTALVYQPYYKVIEEEQETRVIQSPLLNGELFDELLQRGNFIGGMSVPLIRTECIKKIGGFDELMHVAEDMDLWLRLAKQYNIISIDIPLVRYHIHKGEQLTTNAQKAIAGIERLNEKYKDYLENNIKVKWKRQLFLIKFYLQTGKRREAFDLWKRTIVLCPGEVVRNTKELIRIIVS